MCFDGSLCVLSIWLIVVCFDALFVCCPCCSFRVSSISELCKHCLTSCGGRFWFSQAFVSLLCVNWSSIFSMKIVCVFSSISEYAPWQICFLPPSLCVFIPSKSSRMSLSNQNSFCFVAELPTGASTRSNSNWRKEKENLICGALISGPDFRFGLGLKWDTRNLFQVWDRVLDSV